MPKQEKHPKTLGENKISAGQGKRGRKGKGMCFEDRPILEANAAGIDIGAREIYVAVPPDRDEHPVRVFSTFTEDLERMGEWLVNCGITTAAMESTGVYWIAPYDVLERHKVKPCLGVPGSFVIEGVFPSTQPEQHEREAHERLGAERIESKEFFRTRLEEAIRIISAICGAPSFLRTPRPDENREFWKRQEEHERLRQQQRRPLTARPKAETTSPEEGAEKLRAWQERTRRG